MTQAPPASPAEYRGGLTSTSFLGLLGTQFLGAWNDNMLRWLVVFIGKQLVDAANAPIVLSGGMACFVIPYILFATHAGFLANRYSKRTVIVGCKVLEIVIIALGLVGIWISNIYLLLGVVAMMGTQSALFSPSKLGSLPEMLKPERLSKANGLFGLTTVIATVGGTAAGAYLFAVSCDPSTGAVLPERFWIPVVALGGVAVVGWLFSLLVARLPVASPDAPFPVNPFRTTFRDLMHLGSNRALLRVALGSAFFWSLASLSNLNLNVLVVESGWGVVDPEKRFALLSGVLAFGVGVGSVLAGLWSGGKVELGIVPLGAAGIAASSMLILPGADSLEIVCFLLFALGTSAGLFDVPLASYLQHRSPADTRGSILAAANFLTFVGILLVAGLFVILQQVFQLDGRSIFFLSGLATIPVVLYVLFLLPFATIRFLVWLASHTVYRVRVFGHDNLPETGGALLVPNHVSWADGVFLLMSSSRPIRMIAYGPYVEAWPVRWLARMMKVIPIRSSPKSIRQALDTARQAVLDGELVCIFAEGQLTRTGQLQTFQRGLMRIVKGTDVPIVPVYLDELWGSVLSYRGGRFFWKWPQRWPYPVSIHFGEAITEPEDVHYIRQAVVKLGVEAVEQRKHRERVLPREFLRMCKRQLFRHKIADSTGAELTGGQLLMRSIILARLLRREVLGADERMVGVLLPPSSGAVVVNAALPLLQRVSVNLNYTVSADVLNSCIRQCQIKHVLTSRKVMEKMNLELDAEIVYLDDFKEKVTLLDKLRAAISAYLTPVPILERVWGVASIKPDDLMTVIFTSGSTGEPKGVMLSYNNVGSNVQAIDTVVDLGADDTILGILPFFHSFGYTVTLWAVLVLPPMGAYHFTPLDPRQVGKLCQKYKATILLATPTFLRSYLKRCEKEQLQSLELVIVGAEKLPLELADAFNEKFGTPPQEGYGTTELSPLVSVNVPDFRAGSVKQIGTKPGTVGRPVPGVAAKIVDPETYEELGAEQPGMLLISGPNVMLGYLNKPEATDEKMRDGWYITGDIALIDTDGFIKITGRQSRFSKIGGEMVPHIRVEEAIAEILEADEEHFAVVTAVPDEKKGERLVVIHTDMPKTVDDVCQELKKKGLPNLWIPSPDSFIQVDEIPVLGTGKVALAKVKELAEEKFTQAKA